MKISVMCGSFRKGFEGGIAAAKALGAAGVQVYAGEVVDDFSKPICAEKAKAARKTVDEAGLVISAVCVELGGFACDAAEVPGRIAKTKRMIELAEAMEIKTVTAHIGHIPNDKADEKYIQIKAALTEIGAFCESKGMVFAVETGPEKAPVLKMMLEDVASAGLGVNLDPANLVMCSDDDPVEAVKLLAPYIRHCHAKDGICLTRAQHKPWPDAQPGQPWIEVPLGSGEVPFPEWIAALKSIGFDGYLAIERECGDDPAKDIATAMAFLKTQI